jgi:hypothetical protein
VSVAPNVDPDLVIMGDRQILLRLVPTVACNLTLHQRRTRPLQGGPMPRRPRYGAPEPLRSSGAAQAGHNGIAVRPQWSCEAAQAA